MRILFLALSFLIASSWSSYAHLGHVGEVAGHAHWIGIGAVIAAGVLAGVWGLLSDKDDKEEVEAEEETPEGQSA